MSHPLIPLCLMAIGEMGTIRHVAGTEDHVHRLSEIGLRHGSVIEVMQDGQPCIVRVAGQKLCFRGDDLTNVLVEPRV